MNNQRTQKILELVEKTIKILNEICNDIERIQKSAFMSVDSRNFIKMVKTTLADLIKTTLQPYQMALSGATERQQKWEYLKNMLRRDEGLRLEPYRDSEGRWTVGYGTLLDRIFKDEAEMLLDSRLEEAATQVILLPHYEFLNEPRQFAIINLVYNIGIESVKGFRRMWRAAGQEDWESMADELLDSKYARQVGLRAQRLAQILRTGVLPGEK